MLHSKLLSAIAFVFGYAIITSTAIAQVMRYNWESGKKFSYQMEVVVDSDDETVSYKGIIHYTVNDTNANQATVTYRGGLSESKTFKQRASRFGPRGFGPPSIPSPFSEPTFRGKTQTTNKLTLTTRGQTLAMEGDSQLPYLLGNISLIPFEPLPEANQRQWAFDTGVSITEKSDNDRFGRFGPFGPRGPLGGNVEASLQAAGEQSNFAIQSKSGDLVVVKKTYRLHTPSTKDNPELDLVGNGTWTFDRKENIPHAYDMQYSLKVKKGNTTTTIPITVKYDRISAEQLAEMDAAEKQRAAELAKAAAEKKAMAETPLTAAEKSEAIFAMASSDATKIQSTLEILSKKSLPDPDPEIAVAIEKHLASSNRSIAGAAHKAMAAWSPDYTIKKKLEKEYQGPAPLKSTGLVVESITPLYVGQLVQAQRKNRGRFWFAARIKSLPADGQVELEFLTWGKVNTRDTEMVSRRNIQLAPPELEQPNQAHNVVKPMKAAGNSRTWTDATGKFKVDAEFISVTDGKVNLRRADGRTMSIHLEKLSDADQLHLKELQETESENPFQLN